MEKSPAESFRARAHEAIASAKDALSNGHLETMEWRMDADYAPFPEVTKEKANDIVSSQRRKILPQLFWPQHFDKTIAVG